MKKHSSSFKPIIFLFLIFFAVFSFSSSYAQELDELEVGGEDDLESVLEESSERTTKKNENKKKGENISLSEREEKDDLESLKEDLGDIILEDPLEDAVKTKVSPTKSQTKEVVREKDLFPRDEISPQENNKEVNGGEKKVDIKANIGTNLFEAGEDEKKLLELAKFVQAKIPFKEWKDISGRSQSEKYTVQKGDYLWKISQKLFGTGFYYSKIWSLNPYIKNPHEIEPGMVLVFDTGDSDSLPSIQVGSFEENLTQVSSREMSKGGAFAFNQFGEEIEPKWIREREQLLGKGVYFQYTTPETYKDLSEIAQASLRNEYEKYEPPLTEIIVPASDEVDYGEAGFDEKSKISYNIKEGFYLNSFVTTNIVQDVGYIVGVGKESVFINKYDTIYIKLDESIKAKPGDKYSIYKAEGKVFHPISDRKGYRYTITAQIQLVKKINKVWEAKVFEISGVVQRKDRLTLYTPKVKKIYRTFAERTIEAAIVSSYHESANGLSFGNVTYLDRGRIDGVELGTVFEIYDFKDKATGRRITPDPTYKIGELTVITMTDNFATALVTHSSDAIHLGALAISKSKESAAFSKRLKGSNKLKIDREANLEALDELDVELNIDDIGESLLDQVDQIQMTEDELEELEKEEREKSIIKDHEKDLQELERLEQEITDAETKLRTASLDEDKYLEQTNLDEIEKKASLKAKAFDSMDQIEEDIGKVYMDEKLKAKENKYGLSEYDVEEIDNLMSEEINKGEED